MRLRLALDPDCEPVFRGIDLSGDGLRRLAAGAATSGVADDAATCAALLDARVLAAHGAQPGRREWASFDAEWLAADAYAVEQLGRIRSRAYLPALDAAGAAAIRVQPLNAIVDPDGRARLLASADDARDDAHARTQAWFAELADRHATGRESLGIAAVLVAADSTATAESEWTSAGARRASAKRSCKRSTRRSAAR